MKVKTWRTPERIFHELKMTHKYVKTETNYTDGGGGGAG